MFVPNSGDSLLFSKTLDSRTKNISSPEALPGAERLLSKPKTTKFFKATSEQSCKDNFSVLFPRFFGSSAKLATCLLSLPGKEHFGYQALNQTSHQTVMLYVSPAQLGKTGSI